MSKTIGSESAYAELVPPKPVSEVIARVILDSSARREFVTVTPFGTSSAMLQSTQGDNGLPHAQIIGYETLRAFACALLDLADQLEDAENDE